MFNLSDARNLMIRNELDGLIVSTPENFYYVTGCYPKSLYTRASGMETVVIPTDESKEPAVIISEHDAESFRNMIPFGDIRTYETWIYFEKEGVPQQPKDFKPEQYNPMVAIAQALKDKGLTRRRIGIEENLISASTYNKIKGGLTDAILVNATTLFYEMRSVKDTSELEKFREAIKITEKATAAALARAREGTTDRDLAREYKKTASALGAWLAGHCGHVNFSSGPDSGAAHVAGPFPESTLRTGDIMRLDVGVYYDGVMTDIARAYSVGEPSPRLIKWHETIVRANRKIVENIKPGVRFCDLFRIGLETVREVYPQYIRGHLGHSISIGPNPEEPPFISPKESREVEPRMVLCIEVPFYIVGFGGINIEDMVIVTDDGIEELTHLYRGIEMPVA